MPIKFLTAYEVSQTFTLICNGLGAVALDGSDEPEIVHISARFANWHLTVAPDIKMADAPPLPPRPTAAAAARGLRNPITPKKREEIRARDLNLARRSYRKT
ncbi:hypothetical protein TWF730_009125 [Orbilia blumenaviensis]|uniref:Uncharacterized protein n=1 Tax=Orbilia blumenaviensis TaxID=1796055 RepID=A0AAV9V0H5_9PEZI